MKMNMFDEARALSDMLKMRNMTQSEIADLLGVSQSYVANKIRLLRLPCAVKDMILEHDICERQARQLLRLSSEERMIAVISEIKKRKMTVAESEIAVDMQVEKEAPKRLCAPQARERIRSFEGFIDEAIASLSSVGVSAEKRVETSKGKRYITILINEG